MSAVEKWREGKSSEIAALALMVAKSAPEAGEALSEMRKQINTKISQPPLELWLSNEKHIHIFSTQHCFYAKDD